MSLPSDLMYTESHEWVRLNDDGSVTVGITDYAQAQLGDLVFVESPEVDADVDAGDAVAVVESVKAASDIYAPLAGRISESNGALADAPELVNTSPYEDGWLFTMAPNDTSDVEELLSAESYEAFIAGDEEDED
ncbi:glycine cleavage system protein GcvH [Granulosicoccaceae sp. 1_MG-2023]|nr:glycine cleavage system protein GcvH [Granulosicoccaceae sp. 1_MG-2023]